MPSFPSQTRDLPAHPPQNSEALRPWPPCLRSQSRGPWDFAYWESIQYPLSQGGRAWSVPRFGPTRLGSARPGSARCLLKTSESDGHFWVSPISRRPPFFEGGSEWLPLLAGQKREPQWPQMNVSRKDPFSSQYIIGMRPSGSRGGVSVSSLLPLMQQGSSRSPCLPKNETS